MKIRRIFCGLYIILVILILCGKANADLHHIFPQEHERLFNSVGIDVNKYTIPLTREMHTGAGNSIHHKIYKFGLNHDYNTSWNIFLHAVGISHVPFSRELCFGYATLLLGEFGLTEVQEFYDYKKKAPTGETLKIPRFAKILSNMIDIQKIMKYAQIAAGAYLAYETIAIGSAMDDDIDPNSKNIVIAKMYYNDSMNNFNNEEYESFRENIALSFYNVGIAYFNKYVEWKKDYFKEIVTAVGLSKKRANFLKKSIKLFGYAYERLDNNPLICLFYGRALKENGDTHKANNLFRKASNLFLRQNDTQNSDFALSCIN